MHTDPVLTKLTINPVNLDELLGRMRAVLNDGERPTFRLTSRNKHMSVGLLSIDDSLTFHHLIHQRAFLQHHG